MAESQGRRPTPPPLPPIPPGSAGRSAAAAPPPIPPPLPPAQNKTHTARNIIIGAAVVAAIAGYWMNSSGLVTKWSSRYKCRGLVKGADSDIRACEAAVQQVSDAARQFNACAAENDKIEQEFSLENKSREFLGALPNLKAAPVESIQNELVRAKQGLEKRLSADAGECASLLGTRKKALDDAAAAVGAGFETLHERHISLAACLKRAGAERRMFRIVEKLETSSLQGACLAEEYIRETPSGGSSSESAGAGAQSEPGSWTRRSSATDAPQPASTDAESARREKRPVLLFLPVEMKLGGMATGWFLKCGTQNVQFQGKDVESLVYAEPERLFDLGKSVAEVEAQRETLLARISNGTDTLRRKVQDELATHSNDCKAGVEQMRQDLIKQVVALYGAGQGAGAIALMDAAGEKDSQLYRTVQAVWGAFNRALAAKNRGNLFELRAAQVELQSAGQAAPFYTTRVEECLAELDRQAKAAESTYQDGRIAEAIQKLTCMGVSGDEACVRMSKVKAALDAISDAEKKGDYQALRDACQRLAQAEPDSANYYRKCAADKLTDLDEKVTKALFEAKNAFARKDLQSCAQARDTYELAYRMSCGRHDVEEAIESLRRETVLYRWNDCLNAATPQDQAEKLACVLALLRPGDPAPYPDTIEKALKAIRPDDIPKTPFIVELIRRAEQPPAPRLRPRVAAAAGETANAPAAPSFGSSSSASPTFSAQGFAFQLTGCTYAGGQITVNLMITNQEKDRALFEWLYVFDPHSNPYVVSASRIIDDSGRELNPVSGTVGLAKSVRNGLDDSVFAQNNLMIQNVPTTASIVFDASALPEITKLRVVSLRFSQGVNSPFETFDRRKDAGGFDVQFRNALVAKAGPGAPANETPAAAQQPAPGAESLAQLDAKGFTFRLIACRLSGGQLTARLVITNDTGDAKTLCWHFQTDQGGGGAGSRIVDDNGMEAFAVGGGIGRETGQQSAERAVGPGVTVDAYATFEINPRPQFSRLQVMSLQFRSGGEDFDVQFRNIPVTQSGTRANRPEALPPAAPLPGF